MLYTFKIYAPRYISTFISVDYHLICLDANEAKAALAEAQASLSSAATDEAKAEAQIAVEVAEELIKACAA